MLSRFFAALALLLSLLAGGMSAARADGYTIPGTRVLPLPTAPNGIDYELYLRVPEACTPQTPCPVLYMLDAEYAFGLSALIAEHLEARGRLRPVILVGIAYQDKTRYRANRTRDYTPVFVAEGGYGPDYQAQSGGGPAFLDVIANTIIPEVENRFPADPAARGLMGHSYGGLFATFAMLDRPDLFADFIIVSPSYWYQEGRFIPGLAAAHDAPRPHETDAYFAVGSWEEQPENGRAMVSDLQRFVAGLEAREDPRLNTLLEVMESQSHASIFPLALSNGLRALYGPVP